MKPPQSSPRGRIAPDARRRQAVTRAVLDPHLVRFLLDRSSDSAGPTESSQDYLVIQGEPDRFAFAVTDGVGSSFRGEVAAQMLATHLVDLLMGLPAVPDERRLAEQLTRGLGELTAAVRDEVRRIPIPAGVAGVVQSVLAEQREYGSEAMFVCGRIDVEKGRPARVGLAWLGDCSLRVLTDSGDRTLTGATAERWSSDRGPRGKVHAWSGDAGPVRRIIGYTDGALPEAESVLRLPDDELDARLAALARRPDSDDIAVVDIALRPDAMPPARGGGATRPVATAPEPPPESSPVPKPEPASGPAPAWLPRTAAGVLGWAAVEGAGEYTVEFASDPKFTDPIAYRVSRTTFTAPSMGARAWVRVRGHLRDGDGRWSEPIELGRPAASAPPSRPPRLRCIRTDERRGRIHLEWDRVPGQDSYILRVEPARDPGAGQDLRAEGQHAVLSLPPARYRISVRADRPGDAEVWSDPIDVWLR